MKSLLKKILIICGIICTVSITTSLINTRQAFADDNSTQSLGTCRDFAGFTSWDCNATLSDVNNPEDLKSNVWIIVANVAIDITVAAAYLVVGYVIYGGYLYTLSGGEASKVATGKKAIYQAFIGLAIVLLANIILNSIRLALGNVDFSKNYVYKNQGVDPLNLFTSALSWVIGIAGFVSAIFVVYGGISYSTSAGDPGKLKKAKDMITYALIGLAIVALSETLVIFISNAISNSSEASTETSHINQTIISKEFYETQNN